MDFLYFRFYACLRLRFLDVETNPGLRRPVHAVCRILCSNVRAWPGTLVTCWSSSQYDIMLCSEILVSDMRHVSELLVPGFGRPVLLCRGKMPRARGMAAYIRDGRLVSLRCSARIRHCLVLLVRVVDWCVSLLVRLICCWIILTANSPGKCNYNITTAQNLSWLVLCMPKVAKKNPHDNFYRHVMWA